MPTDRRSFLKLIGASGLLIAAPGILTACGDDDDSGDSTPSGTATAGASPLAGGLRGSGEKIRVGFIALTDCASLVMAEALGLYKQYGLNVEIQKQASWANVRDGLLTGELDAAHCLFGMPFSVYTGVGGEAGKEMQVAMVLNTNGQAITLAGDQFGGKVGFRELDKVAAAVDELKQDKEVTFAMTFPGGTHDMWLRYWLAAAGVDQQTVKIITIPPPQMVANMKVGNMDGFCVGEPWNGIAVSEGVGFTHLASQDIWKHHPEKALVVNTGFASNRRDDLKLLMRATIEASIWLDDLTNRPAAARELAKASWVNAEEAVIAGRLEGAYDLGGDLGEHRYTDDTMLFHNGGLVNKPRAGHAIWFMTQYVRFGYLDALPDAKAIADRLIIPGLYEEVAADLNIAVPGDDMTPFRMTLDDAPFDPADPEAYLKAYGGVA